VQADPDNLAARAALAEVMTNSGDRGLRSAAIAQYQAILREEPSNVQARLGLGRVYSYNGNYPQARAQFNQILTTQRTNEDALLGLAETERFAGEPFEARRLYNRVIDLNPRNEQAREGLSNVRRLTSPSITASYRNYSDTNDVRIKSFLLGPTFRFPAGTIGVTSERGTYEDEDVRLRRNALNLLLARNFGGIQARLLLNRVRYTGAPSRNLYDLLLQKAPNSRQRYYVNLGRREVAESLGALQDRIMAREIRAGFTHPLGARLDLEGEVSRLNYTDGNNRTTFGANLMYRVLTNTPVFRVGVGYRNDDSRFESPLYYTPQGFNAFSLLADLSGDTGRMRYGLSAGYPLSQSSGNGGENRPARTLFGYLDYDASELVTLFINGGIVDAPTFESRDVTLGGTLFF